MKCDRIVVIHKGKVVEDGTYDELSAKPDGHFSKLKAGIAWKSLMHIKSNLFHLFKRKTG